jgi:excisionase family DNA binding protein
MVAGMEAGDYEASVAQAARALGVSASTVRRWLASGKLAGRRTTHGRGTPWRVLLPAELPVAAARLRSLLREDPQQRLRALEQALAEAQRALVALQEQLARHEAEVAVPVVPTDADVFERVDRAVLQVARTAPALPAPVVAAGYIEAGYIELVAVAGRPSVTSIVLGREPARYELPPAGEGIGWLRRQQRRRRWPRLG